MKRAIHKKRNGFTLIEMVVVTAVFALIVIMVANVFVVAMGGINRAYAKQNALDSLRFINESIAKELRTSSVSTAAGGPLASIDIQNQAGQAINYSFSGNNLIRTQGGVSQILNADNAVIASGAFYVWSAGSATRVTVVMNVINFSPKNLQQAAVNTQTTISTR